MAREPQIFPHELTSHAVESFFNRYNSRTRIIYLTVLAATFIAFILLFIIRVDISVKSTGIIKPMQERSELRAGVQGVVDSLYVVENANVKAGQTLIKLRSNSLEDKQSALGYQRSELEAQLADLRKLVAGNSEGLQSELYIQQHSHYRQKLADVQTRLNVVSKNYTRFQKLYRERVVAAAEFEQYQYQRNAVASELQLVRSQQMDQWQSSLTRISLQLSEMDAQGKVYSEQEDLFTIRAPVNGTVQQLKALQPGTVVNINEVLGEISPDTALIAESYVLPKDIGLLKPGMTVRMQVDAFNYNQWGMAEGKVLSISNDAFMENGMPYFKVRCVLDRSSLELRNGYKGELKKGMTIQARFIVTRRSLFQLLYDKADNWLNPGAG